MRVDFVGKSPVSFEGRELPQAAKLFELLPFCDDLCPNAQEWLMDLQYSWGRTRHLSSRRVVRYTSVIREKLNLQNDAAKKTVGQRFPDATETEINEFITDWFRALDIMDECARQTFLCLWSVAPTDEDLENNLKLAIKLVRDGPRGGSPLVKNLPPGWEFRVQSMTRDRQIEFLNQLTDALSKPEGAAERFLQRVRKFLNCF